MQSNLIPKQLTNNTLIKYLKKNSMKVLKIYCKLHKYCTYNKEMCNFDFNQKEKQNYVIFNVVLRDKELENMDRFCEFHNNYLRRHTPFL